MRNSTPTSATSLVLCTANRVCSRPWVQLIDPPTWHGEIVFEDEDGLGLLGYYLLQVPHNTEGCVLLGGEARGHTEGVGHTGIVVTLVTGSSLGMKF